MHCSLRLIKRIISEIYEDQYWVSCHERVTWSSLSSSTRSTSVLPSAVSFRPGVSSYWDIRLRVEAEMFVCVTVCFLHDICKYVIWWWCIEGVDGERVSPATKDGQGQATAGAGHGRRTVQHSENNAGSLKGSFYQEKGPRGFIYLCCCFVGKKHPQIQKTITIRTLEIRNWDICQF